MNRILQVYKSVLRKVHARSQVATILCNAAYDPALSLTAFYSVCVYAVNVFCDGYVKDDVFGKEVSPYD